MATSRTAETMDATKKEPRSMAIAKEAEDLLSRLAKAEATVKAAE